MMYSMMGADVNLLFGIKPVEPRSLTLASIEDSQAKLRRATKTPQMVVCHPDNYDDLYALAKEFRWLALGTIIQASDRMTDSQTVYVLWDMEEKEDE